MGTFARIYEGKVVEIFEEPDDGFTMEERFHPDLIWTEITDLKPGPQQGWTATQNEQGGWILAAP